MVVPNASSDVNYASNFLKQFLEYLIRTFKTDGQRLINNQLEQFDHLNRKSLQDRCDGQLLMKQNLDWLIDYIEKPTKIIEDEFKILWEDALRVINRKLIEDKSSYSSVLDEFFFCLKGIRILEIIFLKISSSNLRSSWCNQNNFLSIYYVCSRCLSIAR